MMMIMREKIWEVVSRIPCIVFGHSMIYYVGYDKFGEHSRYSYCRNCGIKVAKQ